MTKEKTEERKNRFNGESVMLTKEQARIHDKIFIDEIAATIEDRTLGTGGSKHWNAMRKGLDWFRQHNAKAELFDQRCFLVATMTTALPAIIVNWAARVFGYSQ